MHNLLSLLLVPQDVVLSALDDVVTARVGDEYAESLSPDTPHFIVVDAVVQCTGTLGTKNTFFFRRKKKRKNTSHRKRSRTGKRLKGLKPRRSVFQF